LLEAATKHEWRIHAYVLMTNGVRLLASAEQPYALSQTRRAPAQAGPAIWSRHPERGN